MAVFVRVGQALLESRTPPPILGMQLARAPVAHPLEQGDDPVVGGGVLPDEEACPVAARLDLDALAPAACASATAFRNRGRAGGAEGEREEPLHRAER